MKKRWFDTFILTSQFDRLFWLDLHVISLSLQFNVRATDNRPSTVARSAESTVVITIIRDSGPPQFVNTPYITSVPINKAINSSFFNVQAIDNDLRVGFSLGNVQQFESYIIDIVLLGLSRKCSVMLNL